MRMSTNDVLRAKKQFKSQSVNSLFRQQTNGSENQDGKLSSSSLSTKKKSNGSATKLKLVSRKLNTVNRSKLEKKKSESPKENSPTAVWNNSRSSSPELSNGKLVPNDQNGKNGNVDKEVKDQKEISNSIPTPQETPEPVEETNTTRTPEIDIELPNTTQRTIQGIQGSEVPITNSTNRNDDDESDDNIWLDLQTQIHNETKNNKNHDSSWAPTNTKLASFRKSSQTPTAIQSLTHSPLISTTNNTTHEIFNESPIDFFTLNNTRQPSTESIFFNNGHDHNNINNNNNNMINHMNHSPNSFPQNGQIRSPNVPDNNPWSTNFNLWGNDDRQLSTKSDSFLWSPFNQNSQNHIDKIDDPLKRIGLESQARNTSRFFPSPNAQQEQSFPMVPTRSTSDKYLDIANNKQIDEGINDIIKMIEPQKEYPNYLQTSTFKSEGELFPEEFQLNQPWESSTTNIPVSFPGLNNNYHSNINMIDNNTTQQELKKPSFNTSDQYYPEGFASTFYKRGINNFMFVRELQPKLITSKAKDTVEVRVSLPSIKTNAQAEEDVFFKMRCYIINVSLRELNGKNNNGYRLSQKSNMHTNNHNGNNVNGNNGKPRFGNQSYKKGNSNGYYRKTQ